MAEMTLAEIDEALAALRTVKTQRLVGGVRTKTAYQGGSVERQVATLEEINAEIARLELLRSKITGQPSGGGPVLLAFGDRY